MQNKRTMFKVGCGAVAASAVAAGVIFELMQQEKLHQFSQDGKMTPQDYEFMQYVSTYGKSYPTTTEYKQRASNWQRSDEKINAHNNNPLATSRCAHNRFSTWSATELKSNKGLNASQLGAAAGTVNNSLLGSAPTANGVDWVAQGKVTPVQNQAQCGGCWAFSATGCISSRRAIAGHPLEVFSEQQLIDCDTNCHGCNGGLMDYAFMYAQSHPLETRANYPYTAVDGTCKYSASNGVGSITGYQDVPQNSVDALKNALLTGPVSVAVEADQTAFQQYSSGVVSTGCGQNLDHGILAVGYGTENGQDFFLVKNQWGATWGDNGYIKIAASSANVCGILSYPSYVTV